MLDFDKRQQQAYFETFQNRTVQFVQFFKIYKLVWKFDKFMTKLTKKTKDIKLNFNSESLNLL